MYDSNSEFNYNYDCLIPEEEDEGEARPSMAQALDNIIKRIDQALANIKGVFAPFDSDHELINSVGIDGITSSPITYTALSKVLKQAGYSSTDIEFIREGDPLYPKLRNHFIAQGQFINKKGSKTTFARVMLGTNRRRRMSNCLFIVFNDRSLNNLARARKKHSHFYCRLSLQGLHQPTRQITTQSVTLLYHLLKHVKLSHIDIATDLRKVSSLESAIDDIKGCIERIGLTKTRCVIPKAAGSAEKGLYFNAVNSKDPIKCLKFYDKYTKQVNLNRDKIRDSYTSWFRTEMSLRCYDKKFKQLRGYFCRAIKRFDNILRASCLVRGVKFNLSRLDLFKFQLKVFSNLKFAKKAAILPDIKLFELTEVAKKYYDSIPKRSNLSFINSLAT